jgi:alanyl-tRNA synthetase
MSSPMTSDEIRSCFFGFFEARDHRRIASGSLVPATHDPSVLLTTAGMQPLKPYFQGQETPPHPRLASCQKCFRTVDIDVVGTTARHLTFFEMLGNFSIGDYFKQRAVELAWELSLTGFGFAEADIWITVFEGDEELGIGLDQEAVDAWLSVGVPRERIVALPRSENFWQAGPLGPCGPCSELYLDRGVQFGTAEDLPGGDNDRFLEYWNLVFMQYDQNPVGTLRPLPAQSIDTGLGLNRMAAILQDKPSVFETDQFWPLIELSQTLSGRTYGEDESTTRAMRILADHSRGMTFLLADGVVPSNEDRGYVLRRIMRRAIQRGRSLGLEPGFLPRYAEVVEQTMGPHYPELGEQRDAIMDWLVTEEEGFGRTLEQGTRLLEDVIARALEAGAPSIAAADAFALHDTYGFPIDLTRDLAAERGLGVEDEGFDALMQGARELARGAGGSRRQGGGDRTDREAALAFSGATGFATRFTGYETVAQPTTVGAAQTDDGFVLVKLEESPFYAQGGGQVSDGGVIESVDGDWRARVEEVFRLGDDQAIAVAPEAGELEPGERVLARVDRRTRHATEANHTATHLLHAALRRRLGPHVRQAGSYVGPDKLRFDFSHGHALSDEELRDVEDEVNRWVLENHAVRPIITTLDEARGLGAMALFGEKYGDVVRMVEIGDGDFSRELCGGTHVRSTAEIGVMRIVSETSSAANVRRIEALTGPEAVALLRRHDAILTEVAQELRTTPEETLAVVQERERRRKDLEKGARSAGQQEVDVAAIASRAVHIGGVPVLTEAVTVPDAAALMQAIDLLKGRLPDAAIVLGSAVDRRVHLAASVAPALVERGVRAGEIVKLAAGVVGGGGGGRDTVAQAGGRDPERLPEALAAARGAIETALEQSGG